MPYFNHATNPPSPQQLYTLREVVPDVAAPFADLWSLYLLEDPARVSWEQEPSKDVQLWTREAFHLLPSVEQRRIALSEVEKVLPLWTTVYPQDYRIPEAFDWAKQSVEDPKKEDGFGYHHRQVQDAAVFANQEAGLMPTEKANSSQHRHFTTHMGAYYAASAVHRLVDWIPGAIWFAIHQTESALVYGRINGTVQDPILGHKNASAQLLLERIRERLRQLQKGPTPLEAACA